MSTKPYFILRSYSAKIANVLDIKHINRTMARPILIIEDDPDIAENVKYNLEREGFNATVGAEG